MKKKLLLIRSEEPEALLRYLSSLEGVSYWRSNGRPLSPFDFVIEVRDGIDILDYQRRLSETGFVKYCIPFEGKSMMGSRVREDGRTQVYEKILVKRPVADNAAVSEGS